MCLEESQELLKNRILCMRKECESYDSSQENCPVCGKGVVNYSSYSERFKNSKLIVIQAINESVSRGEIPFDIGNRAIQTITELPNV